MAIPSFEEIFEYADKPERTRGDEGEIKERSVKDLIELDRYRRRQLSTFCRPFGCIFVSRPSGTVRPIN